MVPARKYRAPSVYCVLRGRVSRPRREEGGIWGCWAGLPPSENSRLPWAVVSSSDWPRPAAHTATPPPADAKLGAAEHSPSVVASLRAANILCLFCSTQRKQQCRAGVACVALVAGGLLEKQNSTHLVLRHNSEKRVWGSITNITTKQF